MTSRYSNLRSLIFYSIYLIGYFYTHSPPFFFQVSASLHCYCISLLRFVVDLFDLIITVGCCYSVNQLNMILQNLHVYYVFDYLIWRFLWCIYLLWGYWMLCVILAITKRICVLWFYKLCFPIRCLVHFSNRTMQNFGRILGLRNFN